MKTNLKNQPIFRSNCEIAIHVPSLIEAEAFYAGVLGFRLVTKSDDGLEFDTGSLRLFVNRDTDAVYSYIPSLNVSNYETARNYLENAGCKTISLCPPCQGVYFQDPFGLVFDIVERP
jgi:catechol 2,3-dioxygenase-like lactoylglutathione lyase family enzyme